ncbi:MAG: amidase [Candidatus Neomarinimicrobiota bacterium]
MKLLKPIFYVSILLVAACSNKINIEEITIDQIQKSYQNGDYTISELMQAYLDRIDEIDKNGPALNSILQVNPDVMQIAKELDEEMKNGQLRGLMHGIPVVLKDNIDTHDKMNTTAGSIALANSKPLQDSWVAQKLRESGAVILGKANLSEWANFHSNFSSSGWSAVGGQTKNPYDISRNPCGSSAGSGVAVAANLCVIAIGTETNGSIVCPSNNNGIVGIKPTVGLLSRSGIVPISFTQDTPGPMARTVRDAAICLGALTGIDSLDGKTALSEGKSHSDYTQFLNPHGLIGARIAYLTLHKGVHFRVDTLMARVVEFMEGAGATVIEIEEISKIDLGESAFQVLLYEFKHTLNEYFKSLGDNAPVKSLAELIEVTFGDEVEMQYFDHELLRMAEEKGDLNSEEYVDALEEMLWNSRAGGIDRVMDRYNLDAIIAPSGNPAWETDLTNGDNFGQSSSRHAARAGYPNISLPMGFVDGLPVGLSIFGRAWTEPLLLEIAYSYEQGTMHRTAPEFLD